MQNQMPWKPLSFSVPWQAFEQGLPAFVDPEDSVTFPPALPQNYEAQLFFNIGLREVINPPNLAALPRGWRFLAPKPPQVGPAFAVYLNDAGVVTEISYGDGIGAAQQAAVSLWEHPPARVESAQEVNPADYEVWVLRINGLSLEGYWLKATAPQQDLIVPYLTLGITYKSSRIDPKSAYPLTEFLESLASLAKSLLAAPTKAPYRPNVR